MQVAYTVTKNVINRLKLPGVPVTSKQWSFFMTVFLNAVFARCFSLEHPPASADVVVVQNIWREPPWGRPPYGFEPQPMGSDHCSAVCTVQLDPSLILYHFQWKRSSSRESQRFTIRWTNYVIWYKAAAHVSQAKTARDNAALWSGKAGSHWPIQRCSSL